MKVLGIMYEHWLYSQESSSLIPFRRLDCFGRGGNKTCLSLQGIEPSRLTGS